MSKILKELALQRLLRVALTAKDQQRKTAAMQLIGRIAYGNESQKQGAWTNPKPAPVPTPVPVPGSKPAPSWLSRITGYFRSPRAAPPLPATSRPLPAPSRPRVQQRPEGQLAPLVPGSPIMAWENPGEKSRVVAPLPTLENAPPPPGPAVSKPDPGVAPGPTGLPPRKINPPQAVPPKITAPDAGSPPSPPGPPKISPPELGVPPRPPVRSEYKPTWDEVQKAYKEMAPIERERLRKQIAELKAQLAAIDGPERGSPFGKESPYVSAL